MKKAGIIGFGRFGRVLADLLSKKLDFSSKLDIRLGQRPPRISEPRGRKKNCPQKFQNLYPYQVPYQL